MTALVLEKSTDQASIAVFAGGECLALVEVAGEQARQRPDGSWVTGVRQALRQAGMAAAAIETVAIGLGPGSFTGIRSALAFAQGFCLPDQLPLLGVNSVAAMADNRRSELKAEILAVVGDARRGHLWLELFRAGQKLAHDASDLVVCRPEDLPAAIAEADCLITPDWQRIGATLAQLAPGKHLVNGPSLPTAMDIGNWLARHPGEAKANPLPIYPFPAVADQNK